MCYGSNAEVSIGLGALARLESFAEGFLSFVVLVSLLEIKDVGAVADNVGTHGYPRAAHFSGPGFRRVQEFRSNTEAACVFIDDQAVDLGSEIDFKKGGHADVYPSDDRNWLYFGNEAGAMLEP